MEQISWYNRALGVCAISHTIEFIFLTLHIIALVPKMIKHLCYLGNGMVFPCILHKDSCPHVQMKPASTYLHVIGWRLIAGSLEGLCHIAKDLYWRQEVTSVEVPPLGEIQQVFCDLGHPIPRQHPLALGKVPLNLQKQERTELGASVSSVEFARYTLSYTFRLNGVQKIRKKDSTL